MNTLSDLRSMLGEHAEQVDDGEAVARTAAVRHRVSVVRRRRRAVGAGVLSLALLVGGAATLAIHGHSDALPSAPTVLGVKAPTTMTSLGYTYRTDGSSETFSGHGSVGIDASSQPRLFSWTTNEPTTVTLKLPDGEYWTSTESDFRDFVVVPPGEGGSLAVSTTSGRVGLASYALTDVPLPGAPMGDPRSTFRREVAGTPLVGGLITHGRHVRSSSRLFPHVTGQLRISVLCTGAPAGSLIHVAMLGSESTSGCDDSASFDPGSNVVGSMPTGRHARMSTFRAWVTAPGSSKPLVVGSRDQVEMGVGLYGPVDGVPGPGGLMERTIEYGGHTWQLTGTKRSSGSPIRFRAGAEQPSIAMIGMRITSGKPTFLHLFAAGMPPQQSGFSGKGGGISGPYWIPAHAAVRITRSTPGVLGVGIYTRTE